jgi:hypothetical protein
MFQKQTYIDKISKEDMEEGLSNLKIGDLVFDPWYGFGIAVAIKNIQIKTWLIKFYDKHEQTFELDEDQTYFLKRNIPILLKVTDMPPKEPITMQTWNEMYCIF